MAHLPPRFEPGARLARRYLLQRPIGSGGMSQVWSAVDELLGRPVAVKALAMPLASDPVLRSAMRREAQAAARIAHPNVTQVFDFGEAALLGGAVVPYVVMELLDGENLADRLRAGPLPWQQAVEVCAEVASALAAAHLLGVVHRDIKPGNVMLTTIGVKVVDFGIAAVGKTPAASGLFAGTPAYVAPEILDRTEPTAASDVYALGAVLFEALVGDPPLAAASLAEAAEAHRHGIDARPPAVAGLPAEVARLCLRCLSRSPAHRPTSEELARGLAAALGRPRMGRAASMTATVTGPGDAHQAVGVAPVPVAPAPVAFAPRDSPTLLDPAPRSTFGPGHDRDDPQPAAGALVAPGGWRGWRPSSMVIALALATVTAIGLALLGGVLVLDAADRAGRAVAAGTPASQVPTSDATSAPPIAADSPDATLAAIEALIGQALADGVITDSMAADLMGDVRGLRDQLDGRRGKSIRKRIEEFRHRIEERAKDDRLDAGLADQLDDLLAQLLRTTSERG